MSTNDPDNVELHLFGRTIRVSSYQFENKKKIVKELHALEKLYPTGKMTNAIENRMRQLVKQLKQY